MYSQRAVVPILNVRQKLKVEIITDLGQRQKNPTNAENTTDLSENLQVPSLCCFS